jgi:hypothetical protein
LGLKPFKASRKSVSTVPGRKNMLIQNKKMLWVKESPWEDKNWV